MKGKAKTSVKQKQQAMPAQEPQKSAETAEQVQVQPVQKKKRHLCCKLFFSSLVLFLGALVGALYFLLGTTSGARFALDQAQKFLPPSLVVDTTIEEGSVFRGLTLGKTHFALDKIIDIQADTLILKYSFEHALNMLFQVEQIESKSLHVTLADELFEPSEQVEEEPASDEPFRLPFPCDIRVDTLKLTDFTLRSPLVDVDLGSLSTTAGAHKDNIYVHHTAVDTILVHLKQTQEASAAGEVEKSYPQSLPEFIDTLALEVDGEIKTFDSFADLANTVMQAASEGKRFALVTLHKKLPQDIQVEDDASPEDIATAFQNALEKAEYVKKASQKGVRVFGDGKGEIMPLPCVVLPFDVSVSDFKVTKARYYMEGFDTKEADISLDAAWVDKTIVIPEISLKHEMGEVSARGQMVMDKFFDLDFELKAESYETEANKTLLEGLPYGLKGTFNITGNLTNLIAHAELNLGGYSKVDVQANVLSPALPLRVSLQTREFAWPLFAEPLVNLKRIDLQAEGNLEDGLALTYGSEISGFDFNQLETTFQGQVSFERAHIDALEVKGAYKNKKLEVRANGDVFYGSILGVDARLFADIADGGFLLPQLKGPMHLDADVITLVNNAVKAPTALTIATTPAYIAHRIPRTQASTEDFDDLGTDAVSEEDDAYTELHETEDMDHQSDDNQVLTEASVHMNTESAMAETNGFNSQNQRRLSSDLSEKEYLNELESSTGAAPLLPIDLPEIKAHIRQIRGDIVFNGVKTTIDVANIMGDLQKGFSVKQLRINQGPNMILAEGQLLEDKADLMAMVNIGRLDLLVPEIKGKAQAKVRTSGSLRDLNMDISGNVPRLGLGDTNIKRLVFDSSVNVQTRSFNLTVLSDSLSFTKQMKPFRQCFVDFSGSPMRHTFTFNCGGTSTAYVSMEGGLDLQQNIYNASFLEIYLSTEEAGALSLAHPVDFSFNLDKTSGTVSPIELKGEIGALRSSTLEFAPGFVSTELSLREFNLKSLSDFYPDGIHINAPLDIDADIKVRNAKPLIDVDILSHKGFFVSTAGIALGYDSFTLHSLIASDKLHNEFKMALSEGQGTVDAEINILDPAKKGTLDGYFKIKDFDLKTLSNVGQSFNELQGMMQVDTQFSGNLQQPLVLGSVSLKGNAIPRYNVGQINDFNLKVNALGNQGVLDGYIKLNGENLNLKGKLDWSEGAQGHLHAQATRLPLFLVGYGTALANIDTAITLGDMVNVKGKIEIPTADISIQNVGSSGASASSDEIVVPHTGTQSLMHKEEKPLNTSIDLKVSLGDDVRFSALGMVKGLLVGDLHVKQKPREAIKGYGELAMEYGKVNVYGKKFVVDTAEVLFRNDITQPNLNVLVLADKEYLEEDDVEVGIKVTGPVTAPDIKLFSKPSMSQNEIMSYIFYGHGLDKESMLQTGGNEALLMGLGFSGVSGLVNSITGAFGMQNIQVATQGYGDDTQVAIQGYLNKNIRLSYGYGVFNAVGEFKLRYELMHQLYLEFMSSLDQAVDIIYSFEID